MPVALLLLVLLACPSGAATIDFDGLSDLEVVTTQFLGLTFSNTITLTAGTSLNRIEVRPRSGMSGTLAVKIRQRVIKS
ncbi:MAG: hypothetical protein WD696_21875 [Bryobacteraceae bacterium]